MLTNASSAVLYQFLLCAVLALGGMLHAVHVAAIRDTDYVVALKPVQCT